MRLIGRPACLTSAKLSRPTIDLQLSGDPQYDDLKRNLLQSCGESSRFSRLISRISRYVPGFDYSATNNPEDALGEDIQFLGSLHLVASKSHEQRTVNEIKRVAAIILDHNTKQTISAFTSRLKSRLKMHTSAELDLRLAQSVDSKTCNAWNTLRGELVEELKRFNPSPGIS